MRLCVALAIASSVPGCERADPPVGPPAVPAPEPPPVEAIRSTSVAHEPPAPAAMPVDPALAEVPGPMKRWFLALDREQRHAVRRFCRARRADPCLGLLPAPRGGEDPRADLVAAVRDLDLHGQVEPFCRRTHGGPACDTPLVVAFDGAPIELVASPGTFAFRPGHPVATDWPTARTPWIALDRDGDGAITSGAELFGDGTGARNGFAALAALDDNGDGVIDERDAAWPRVLLWADLDADRASTPDELSPLAATITAIPLAHTTDAVRCVRGNCEGERGSVTWHDATGAHTGAVVDLYLRTR